MLSIVNGQQWTVDYHLYLAQIGKMQYIATFKIAETSSGCQSIMRKVFIVFVALIFNVILAYSQWNIDYFLNVGRDKLKSNDYSASIDYFNTVIRIKPDIADAFFLRAIAKYNLGDYRGAVEDYTTAIGIVPNYSYYYLYRGNAKEKLLDFKGAMADYSSAIDIRINNTEAYISRGITYIILKNYDFAIIDLNVAIMFDKKNPYGYLYRAVAKQYKGQYMEAMPDFTKAIQLDPTNTEAYVKRGKNRYDMKDFKGAIEDFDQAVKIDPKNSLAYFYRAISKYELLDYVGTMKDYDKVIELDPQNDLTYYNRAELKAKVGDFKGAIDDYNKVVQINPTNIFTYFNRAVMYQRLNKNYKAIDDYTAAINLNPEFATAYYNRSIARNSVKDYRGAAIDYDMAVRIKASLKNLEQADRIDTTKLAKPTEFKASFEEGNVQSTKNMDAGIHPFPNFKIRYVLKDSASLAQSSANEKIVPINKEYTSDYLFTLTNKDDKLPQDKADQLIEKLSNTTVSGDNKAKLLARAIMKANAQNYNGSIEDYSNIIGIDPNFSLAYFNRANTRHDIIDFLNSISNLDNNAITLDNSITKTQPQSTQKRTQQNYDDIIADYKKCIQLDHSFYYAYFNLGNVKLESKDFVSAISNYSKAIGIEPKFKEAYYNRGLTYIYVQEKENGCLDLSKAGEMGVQEAYAVIKKYCN